MHKESTTYMVKIAHEAPISIFKRVQQLTGYDYALVHLFEENEEYYQQFVDAIDQGREVILDNSIFELGTAFDSSRFAYWIEKLKPTYYIIPDVLEDCNGTINNFDNWMQNYYGLPGKKIAVAQGDTYHNFLKCYRYLAPKVNKIAISFDYAFFNDWAKQYDMNMPTKYHEWVYGRQTLLQRLLHNNEIFLDKPHHLLGCGLPQEFAEYKHYTFIDSIDTSNPVVAGIKGIRYNSTNGLEDKPSEKLFTLINYSPTQEQISDIEYNINMFNAITNEK